MFIETSALCSILLRDEDQVRISDAMESATTPRITSALARLETCLVVATGKEVLLATAQQFYDELLAESDIAVVAVTDSIIRKAVTTYQSFGKGFHPAKLGFADSIHYALAKDYRIPMLFIGNDFSQTDIISVLANPTPKSNWT